MAASLDREAEDALADLLCCRSVFAAAKQTHADALLRYLRDGRAAGWSWRRIAGGAGVTDRAVQQYWERNRQRVGRLD